MRVSRRTPGIQPSRAIAGWLALIGCGLAQLGWAEQPAEVAATEALAELDRALEHAPEEASLYVRRGRAKFSLQDYAGAIADYDRALALHQTDASVYHERGRARKFRGDILGAIADYDRAIRLRTDEPQVHFDRAAARRDRGDIDGALVDYDAALTQDPRLAEAYVQRGRIRQAQHAWVEALSDFDRYLELRPESSEGYFMRAFTRQLAGNHGGAIADYDRNIVLSGTGNLAHVHRFVCRLRLDPQAAPTALAAEIATWPESWSKDIGRFLAGTMTRDELLTRAWRGNFSTSLGQHCDAQYFLGVVALAHGRPAEAERAFAESIDTGLVAHSTYLLAEAELVALSRAQ